MQVSQDKIRPRGDAGDRAGVQQILSPTRYKKKGEPEGRPFLILCTE